MIERVAGLMAVLAIGAMVVPTEASARGGGFGGARAGGFASSTVVGFHGGSHRAGARPSVSFRPVLPHAVNVQGHLRTVEPLRQHRQPFGRFHGDGVGFGYVAAGVSVFYGWPEAVSDVPASVQPIVPAAPGLAEPAPVYPGAEPVQAFRHVCRSVPEMVPSEQGGAREITITRCYLTIE